MNVKKDFEILQQDIIYFDNAATTFKPKCVLEKMKEYYNFYTSNAGRGEYNLSFLVNDKISETRQSIKKFINAKRNDEIIFTSGCTESINTVVFGYFEKKLKRGDEVILSKSEHISNLLPWLILSFSKGLILKYARLDENNNLSVESIIDEITEKTKVISIAHVTNVVGDVRDIKKICDYASARNIETLIDGAQSVPHLKIDVENLNCDFLCFSAHKMCGPTGLGVLYGKYDKLKNVVPIKFGGGMSENIIDNYVVLKKLPSRLESGTINIEAIISFNESIKYIENLGLENISKHENKLKDYLINKLKKISYINLFNEFTKSSVITFNVKNMNSSDVVYYLNKYNICVRSGDHCNKLLKEDNKVIDNIRISLYFYNTIEEIDKLVEVLKNKELLYSNKI